MQQRRVLAVDDCLELCETLVDVVTQLGYDARFETDGERAVATAISFQPHVLLVDLLMPGLTGYDVAQKIRELPCGRDILVVAMTGNTRAVVSQSMAAGIDVHLVKPIAGDVLRALLHFP